MFSDIIILIRCLPIRSCCGSAVSSFLRYRLINLKRSLVLCVCCLHTLILNSSLVPCCTWYLYCNTLLVSVQLVAVLPVGNTWYARVSCCLLFLQGARYSAAGPLFILRHEGFHHTRCCCFRPENTLQLLSTSWQQLTVCIRSPCNVLIVYQAVYMSSQSNNSNTTYSLMYNAATHTCNV